MPSDPTTTGQPSELGAFVAALKIQSRVIGALVLREMSVRYGRTSFGYLWALLEPVGYIAAFSAIFAFAHSTAPFGQSKPLFFALGVIPFRLFIALGNQLGGAFIANEALLGFPVVKKIDTIIARWILEVITSIAVMSIVIIALHFIDEIPWPNDPLRMGEGFIIIAGMGLGMGLINAVTISYVSSWQNIFRMIATPMLFVSGVFYTIESVPQAMRGIVLWNPVIHGVEIIRDGYYNNYRSAHIDTTYVMTVCVLLVMFGLMLERAVRRGRP